MVVTTAKIPYWFVCLTVILGWNEFMMVLFNPFYFVLAVLSLTAGYVTWYTGMIGPAYQVAKATVGEVRRQVETELSKRLPNAGPAAAGNGTEPAGFELRERPSSSSASALGAATSAIRRAATDSQLASSSSAPSLRKSSLDADGEAAGVAKRKAFAAAQ
ncbi:Dynamin-like GTPase that mediates homotypic ER fusion [Cladochytrium tenue]|nr:Dynamin-like GTPase that mediates homotypic ER fusion [Cladochytrium tenue]